MTFERMRAWTAGALLSTALSTTLASMSPALAQVTPVDEDLVKDGDLDSVMATLQPEFYCVFDVLSQSGAFQDIAAVWVAPDAEQDEIDSADAVLSDAVKECADSYDWSDEVKDFGATVGIHGSVVQVVTEEMLTAGVEEEQLQGVFDILTDMDDADAQTFIDASWVEDYAFKKKMYRALVRFGLPNEDTALENSMLVLEFFGDDGGCDRQMARYKGCRCVVGRRRHAAIAARQQV